MKDPFWINLELGQEKSVNHFCLIAGVELLDCGYRVGKPTSAVGYVRDNSWFSRNIRWLQNVSICPLCLRKGSFVHDNFSRK